MLDPIGREESQAAEASLQVIYGGMAVMAGVAPEGWHKLWPLGVYLFGLMFIAIAVIAIFTGTLVGKGGKIVRAQNPVSFWFTLVLQLAVAAFLMWRGLTM